MWFGRDSDPPAGITPTWWCELLVTEENAPEIARRMAFRVSMAAVCVPHCIAVFHCAMAGLLSSFDASSLTSLSVALACSFWLPARVLDQGVMILDVAVTVQEVLASEAVTDSFPALKADGDDDVIVIKLLVRMILGPSLGLRIHPMPILNLLSVLVSLGFNMRLVQRSLTRRFFLKHLHIFCLAGVGSIVVGVCFGWSRRRVRKMLERLAVAAENGTQRSERIGRDSGGVPSNFGEVQVQAPVALQVRSLDGVVLDVLTPREVASHTVFSLHGRLSCLEEFANTNISIVAGNLVYDAAHLEGAFDSVEGWLNSAGLSGPSPLSITVVRQSTDLVSRVSSDVAEGGSV